MSITASILLALSFMPFAAVTFIGIIDRRSSVHEMEEKFRKEIEEEFRTRSDFFEIIENNFSGGYAVPILGHDAHDYSCRRGQMFIEHSYENMPARRGQERPPVPWKAVPRHTCGHRVPSRICTPKNA